MVSRIRFRPPGWSTHPGFGIAAILAAGALLVVYGEPQPSSRPSGVSVVVQNTAKPATPAQAVLVINAGKLALHGVGTGEHEQEIVTPAGFRPTELLHVSGATVVLGSLHRAQRGYLVHPDLHLSDLGPVDGIVASASGSTDSAMVIETAVGRPGQVGGRPAPTLTPRATGSASLSSTSGTSHSSAVSTELVLANFVAHRVDDEGRTVGAVISLPSGTRLAADTTAGMVVWRPEKQLYDNGTALEPLSAQGILVRPDRTLRYLGPVHPLAASAHDLLVWDVVQRRFGLMPLQWVTSTATSTVSPSATDTPTNPATKSALSGARPSPTPTSVAGVRWFARTRGIVVTGPASFSPDGSAFAAYAEVGARRRLVVARTNEEDTGRIEVAVLALTKPAVKASEATPAPTSSSSESPSFLQPSGSSSLPSGAVETPSRPQFAHDGFPLTPPVTPSWWSGSAIGLGTDGTVIACDPVTNVATLVDFGPEDLESLADAE